MKHLGSILTVIFSMGMILTAELSGEREIIFPEILALLTGAWIAEKQPWKVGKIQLVILMTISALAGVGIVQIPEMPLLLRVFMGFIFTSVILILSRTTLVPVISACILPIFMGTTSLVYPISVFVMSSLIVLTQKILEQLKLREAPTVSENNFSYPQEIRRWTMLAVGFFILSLYPILSGNLYFIAPPLIVTFAGLSNVNGIPGKHSTKILILISAGAVIGTTARLLLNGQFGLPLWLAAGVAVTGLLLCFRGMKILFPPSGAITLLPMILPRDGLMMYPIQVFIGASVLIAADFLLFPKKESE